MANSVTTQILVDGPRNTVVKVEGVLDTSDLAYMTVIDPAVQAGIDNTGALKAKHYRIKKILHNVEDGLETRIWWDATAPVRIEALTGRGKLDYEEFGGLQDNSGAGSTGKICLTTEGWATGKVLSFSLTLELVKQQS